MVYEVRIADSALDAVDGIHRALRQALDAYFGGADAVLLAYARYVQAAGPDTRIPPPRLAPPSAHEASQAWTAGEGFAWREVLDVFWPDHDDVQRSELMGVGYLRLRRVRESTGALAN